MALDAGGSGGGGSSREYCLRWNNHQPNMVSFLSSLLPKESFADVTLVSAEGTRIQAHRIILSACSPYFEGVFESNPCKHPVVILKDVQYTDLRAIVTFIYNGEVNIEVDRINEIIQTAATLQVKGLAEVPADEFKRVSLAGRCSSPAENSSPAPVTRTQPPPPLIMSGSAVRSWPSPAEPSENASDFPVRKKLKKSASANIPFNSGSASTNGN
ncbi:Protein bric-a-brac 2 [Orchesella cincta]|uniref:Protein bric-a-brac 2 n=1 Tax=Orchesella cincta TaxID=48709 RepID=A0A1D2N343_ORCCI|nr:Protein bric-a-brac 2 [Orchesella cincta]